MSKMMDICPDSFLNLSPETIKLIEKDKSLKVPRHVLEKEVEDIKRPTKLLADWELEEIFKLLDSDEHPDRTKYGIAPWEMDALIEHYKQAKEGNIYVGDDTSAK